MHGQNHIKFIFYQILNLVDELPEDGTDVPKRDGLAKWQTFIYVCNLCIYLAL